MATSIPSTLHLRNPAPSTTPTPHSILSSLYKRPPSTFACSAKKRIGFFDQILDYIEGGPKLRKWYGAPDLLLKDGTDADEEDEYRGDVVRDAVLVADGDSDVGQMVILSLIVKRTKVKALVRDERAAKEAFGDYVESVSGDTSDKQVLNRALRGVRAIICPKEGFLSNVESLKGIEHVILLSQLSVYEGVIGMQSVMKANARKQSKQEESKLLASGVPCTIIRAGMLQDMQGEGQGFCFDEGCARKGMLGKEDAAMICVEALGVVPRIGFVLEVAAGEEKVDDWGRRLAKLMEKGGA
ncbi:hypothetical protein MLD38_030761 [Melastoma candidum]|uniref:Uncharacterized protein n=1 Tax=Melastoma candidum TaxID=119954 RepID=A0ACB9MP70_9MYRT|nr:hypothetical protein MLD38_030761 [Melastoma candidum]